MVFDFSEEQLMIQKAARDFTVDECLPGVIERDEKQKISQRTNIEISRSRFYGHDGET